MEKPCCGCAPLIRGPAMRISSGRSIGWTRWPGWFRHEQPPNAAAVSMAEREGFEPSIEFPLYTLSKRAPSTARPSLLSVVSSSLTHVEQIISQPQIGLRVGGAILAVPQPRPQLRFRRQGRQGDVLPFVAPAQFFQIGDRRFGGLAAQEAPHRGRRRPI